MPPLPQPEQQGENTTFTFSEVHPGTATGNFNSSTGAVTLNDSLTLTFTGTGLASITCISTPIDVALSGTWNSTTQNVILATTSSFTIPQFPDNSGNNCDLASPSLNQSPGGVAGSVGNAMSLALNGKFAPGLPTTTTLQASPTSPQLAGTAVTLTATVADPSNQGTPTGNVAFNANGVSIGTSTLSGGTATLTTTTLPQTTNQLTAVYAGDTNYAGSTSTAVPYTVQALPTISSTFPSQFMAGESSFPTPSPFTLTISNPAGGATYASNLFMYLGIAAPPGAGFIGDSAPSNIELSYKDQAGNWCPLALSDSGANPVGDLPNQQDTYAGVYFGGLGTSPCGFNAAFSLNPGQSFTLDMEAAFIGGGSSQADPISLMTGLETGSCTSSASCTAVTPLKGSTAVTSQAASTVTPPTGPGTLPSVVQLEVSTTIRSGFGVTLYGDVYNQSGNNPTPTGTVQFFIDGQLAATTTLRQTDSSSSGTNTVNAVFYNPVAPLSPGSHTLTMNYLGDELFAPSTASRTLTVTVGPPLGTPYVCAVSSPLGGGTPRNFNAYVSVTGAVPTTAFSGTSVTASGVSVTLDLDGGAGSASSLNSGQVNQAIDFSPGDVSVNAGPVTFTNNPATDDVGTWSGLSVTTEVTGNPGDVVPVGVDSISFAYGIQASGSVSCTPVSQPALVGSVSIIGTTLAVSPSGSAPAGSPATLTATVAPLPPAPNEATWNPVSPGTVDFYDGSTYLGTANVDPTAGTASFITNALAVGDHQLSAIWSGYSGVPSNTSNTVDYAVGTNTTTSLASSANPANAANPITFTATVSPPLGALTQPTGDVSFTADGNPISSCQNVALSMASPPTATCTTSFAAGTTHSIVATYSGDGTYLGSASDPLIQTTLPGTNTTIISTKDPSPAGNVTFWSGVSPSSGTGATPTGTVAFTIDGATYKPCAAQPIGSGGGASCTVSFKAGTSHKVFATYAGSATYSGSKSNTITQTVTGAKSSTGPKTTGDAATLASGKTLTADQSLTAGSYKLAMQSDGNLVEYQGPKALWASGTAGHPGAGVTMQKDGNLVEYQGGHAIWASKTSGHPGSHLTLQAADGNVVIYTPANKAVWATGT